MQGKNTEHGTVTHAAFYLKTNKQTTKQKIKAPFPSLFFHCKILLNGNSNVDRGMRENMSVTFLKSLKMKHKRSGGLMAYTGGLSKIILRTWLIVYHVIKSYNSFQAK